jgi:hypothetical protein
VAEDSGQPCAPVNSDAGHGLVRYAAEALAKARSERVTPVAQNTNASRIVLIVAASLELLMAFFAIVGISFDRSSFRSFAGWTSTAGIALNPILAFSALVLAHKGQVREALLVFAGMIALGFLPFLPMLLGPPGIGSEIAFVILAPAPLIAITIAILAKRNRHLGLASALAVVPTAFALLWKVATAFSGPIRF